MAYRKADFFGWYFVMWVLVFVGITVAEAADVSVSWTQPVTNTDGSAIPTSGPGSIATNRVEWGTCAGSAFGTAAGSQSIPAATSYTVAGLAPATHCFRVTATNTYGSTSAASNAAQRIIVAPTPNPPVITSATVVRLYQRGPTQVAGRIELGVECGANKGGTWFVVDRADVRLNKVGRKHPRATLVAKCA